MSNNDKPAGKVEEILTSLPPEGEAALRAHLEGGTPAETLASTLVAYGHQISATTIRTYRRMARKEA